MKNVRIIIVLFLFAVFSGALTAQNIQENKLVVIEGKKFILHQVRTGETIYSLTKKFKVDASELMEYNPETKNGLNIGEILKIPLNENADLSELPAYQKGDPTGFIQHTIENRKETAYSLAKMYGVTVEEIYAYNPTVRKFKKGMTIKIPQWKYEQEKKAETPVVAENEGFRVHTVVSGETLYSISKKYEVSVGEILLHNPDANQLKAGSRLMIPAKKDVVREDVSESTDNFIVHTIVSGESIYGITKKYKVTEAELLALNPSLETGFQTGKQIRIPVKSGWTDVSAPDPEISGVKSISLSPALIMSADAPENCRPAVQPGRNETINVALFLPLFLEANKTLNQDFLKEENDSIEEPMVIDTVALDTLPDDSDLIEEELPMILLKQFHDKSENFLQFYEGVLLAVDSMQKAGMKIKLNVFDTRDNPAAVRNVVNSAEFKTTDLIIGPVYENVQNEVIRVATAHDIPMVSPFVSKSNLINGNPLFFQVNPSRDYLIEASSDMVNVKDTNLNFVVLQTSPYGGTPEGNLVDLIQRKIQFSDSQHKPAFTVYDFKTRRAQGFPELLKKDKENIVIIPTTDEGELSVAISNLNNTTDSISITLLGTSNYQQRYPSIELSHFHNLKLKYINPYWVNYEDSTTIRFYHKFISVFGTEPSGFGIQGFDVAYYFLNAMHYFGEDFTNCLPYFTINLLQGKYYFEKVSSWGGWMNKGVSVLKYQTDFEVKQERIMGLPFDFEKTAVQAKKEPSPFY